MWIFGFGMKLQNSSLFVCEFFAQSQIWCQISCGTVKCLCIGKYAIKWCCYWVVCLNFYWFVVVATVITFFCCCCWWVSCDLFYMCFTLSDCLGASVVFRAARCIKQQIISQNVIVNQSWFVNFVLCCCWNLYIV